MAPCRQLLVWSVPSIAVLLGIYYFRKKREYAKSDPGGREKIKSLQEELADALNAGAEAMKTSPLGKVDRSIIKSSPIDIVPSGNGSLKSSPLELTDEEVDLEIEKLIRNKSLEKEKRLSLSVDRQNSIMGSFKKETAHDFQTCKSESVFNNNEVDLCSYKQNIDDTDIDKSKETILQNVDKEPTQTSTKHADEKCNAEQYSVECGIEESKEDHDEQMKLQNSNEADNISSSNSNSFSATHSRHISERDSANHSPVDPMLVSPAMCHFSDNHSEGSSDSGKGCSEAASPPPANMIPVESSLRIHQFVIPQALVGLLIGKHGSFVMQIKAKTGASVFVRRHPDSVKHKICAVEGGQGEIEAALEMIKEKFPEKRFPNFSMKEISAELYQKLIPLVPEFLQLQLVESVNNDTIMTCLVSAGHFFLQQPLHPTFPSLHALHRLMAATYQNPDVPSLPRPVKEGSICAAPTENNWYRAQVLSTSEESDTSMVKLVDFGGYLTVGNDQLKQIRSDFMTLPFQATEAFLAFVKPAKNETEWSGEALRIMAGLTAGQLLHAQVAGYDETGVPLVNLYLTLQPQQVIFLNRELVERGLAEWDVPADS